MAHLLESRRARFSRWAGAAAVVCAVHIGGAALALMHWPEDEASDAAAGGVVVELAPAAAPVDSPDFMHGPLQEQATFTPQAAKPMIEEVAKDIPRFEPSQAPDPEVAMPVPRPEAKEEPKEEAKEAVSETQNPEPATQASPEMAPPRVEAQPAPSSAPPSPGRSPSPTPAEARWQRKLINHLDRYKQYPSAARSRREQGTVVVAFRIDRSGQVVDSHVEKSSGSSVLDDEALAVLKRASPLPPPPTVTGMAMEEWHLPLHFSFRH